MAFFVAALAFLPDLAVSREAPAAREVTLSPAQIAGFNARYSHNNRKVQPLNERPLIHYAAH